MIVREIKEYLKDFDDEDEILIKAMGGYFLVRSVGTDDDGCPLIEAGADHLG